MARLYEEVGHPRRLEAKAAVVSTLIMQGEIYKGINLGRRVYEEFDKSPDGIELRDAYYSTWAVWKSGAAVHVARGLLVTDKLGPFREAIMDWLIDAREVVDDPRNNFRIRIGEIDSLIKRVNTS